MAEKGKTLVLAEKPSVAADAGREGELVARWILRLSGWKRPFRRLWISSQTDAAIRAGFASLKPGAATDNLFRAAACRAEADWLIGLNVTRALTCKYDFPLSAGRVQTPTLALIIQRENEIKNFQPSEFWTVRVVFPGFFAHWCSPEGGRIFDRARAQSIVSKIDGQTGIVIEVKRESKTEPPPLAYDLAELQRDANRLFSFSAQKTLGVLQVLYERHKLVTYPRTDSRYITSDMVTTLAQRLSAMSAGPYAPLAAPLLQQKLAPGKRFVDDARVSDHHAIIPTEQPLNLSALTAEEKKIYDLLARRFLAVLYPPCQVEETRVIVEAAGERLYARGRAVKIQGWKGVAGVRPASDKTDEEVLPDQSLSLPAEGERLPVRNCRLETGRTKPPPHYTEATLLSAMESPGKFIEDEELRESIKSGGLGTPATRAEIIEKLIGNRYVERRGRELVPTATGIQLIAMVPDELRSPELTARWEQRLSRIAEGQERSEGFMADIRANARRLIEQHTDNRQKSGPTLGDLLESSLKKRDDRER